MALKYVFTGFKLLKTATAKELAGALAKGSSKTAVKEYVTKPLIEKIFSEVKEFLGRINENDSKSSGEELVYPLEYGIDPFDPTI